MEETVRPMWMEVLRPLIYSDLLSNIAFVVGVMLLALLVIGIYKLVARVVRPAQPPELLEQAEGEPVETEEPGEESAEEEPDVEGGEEDDIGAGDE